MREISAWRELIVFYPNEMDDMISIPKIKLQKNFIYGKITQ